MKQYVFFTFFLVFMACHEEPLDESMHVLPLSECIETGRYEDKSFMSSIDEVSYVPFELTDSSVLGNCYISTDEGGRIFVYDLHSVYAFDNKTGSFLSRIKRNGEGPEEYLGISDISINMKDSTVFILDGNRKRINSYSLNDGCFLNSIKSDSIVSFENFDNEKWVFYNSPMFPFYYDICVSDYSWNNRKGIQERIEESKFEHIVPISDFMKYNDGIYTLRKDTIYKIENEDRIEPFIFLDKGRLSIPDEIAYGVKNKQKRHDYIWGETCCFSEEYYFSSYYYNRKVYYDVWNLKERKLCYRNMIESPSDNRGFPVRLNGTIIYVWPTWVKNDVFYCIIDEVESEKLVENFDEEQNSGLIKFRFK